MIRKTENKLTQLKNIGPTSAVWLNDIGVHSRQDLEKMGAQRAYRLIKSAHPTVTIVLLYALQGAILDIHWNNLSAPEKEQIKKEADGISFNSS